MESLTSFFERTIGVELGMSVIATYIVSGIILIVYLFLKKRKDKIEKSKNKFGIR